MNKDNVVYFVIYDSYDEPYGSEIHLLGIFDTRKAAEDAVEQNDKYYCKIFTVTKNTIMHSDNYIGGYVE